MSREEDILKLSKLTNRQLEVLRLVCEGLTYKKVGKQLFISENTVKTHMGNIYIELALDSLPTSERKLVLFQEFCPALQDMDIIPAEVEDQEEPDPVPESVMAMVVRDEKAIVSIPQAEIIDVPYKEIKNQGHPSRLRWMLFGLLLGIILTVLIGFAGWEGYQWIESQIGIGETTPIAIDTEIPTELPKEIVIVTITPIPSTPIEPVVVVKIDSSPTLTEHVPDDTATPTKSPSPIYPLPFEDNFDSGPKPEWQPLIGTWRMIDGTLTADEQNRWNMTFVGDERWKDYTVNVDVLPYNWNWPIRILVRSQGSSYMALETNCCNTYWILVTEGKEHVIAESEDGGLFSQYPWRTNHFKIEVEDNIYTAYSNNVLLLRVQDHTLSNGRVGLAMNHSTRFDNFSVQEN